MLVSFYETASGRSPVTDFIDKQPARDQAVLIAVLEEVENHGFGAKGLQFRQIEGKLWEMKVKAPSGGYRLLYVTINKDQLIVLHAFKKKTQKTPPKEKSLALKRLKEYL